MTNRPTWHEDPAFWKLFRKYLFPPDTIEKASEQVDHLLALLDLDPDATILDIPCGVGRHAVELAERGFDVTGVDVTDQYLETARDRACDTDGAIEFLRRDMREFRRDEDFDAVINLYTSFGYFETRSDDETTAANFYESLRPGGTLLMSLTSKETLAAKIENRTWSEQDDAYVLEEHEITDNWNRIKNRWILVRDGSVNEFDVSHRLYSAFELTSLLENVGFRDLSVYGSLEGIPYDENADHLVVVAHKPE